MASASVSRTIARALQVAGLGKVQLCSIATEEGSMKLGKSANLEGIVWTVAPSGMAERLDRDWEWIGCGLG